MSVSGFTVVRNAEILDYPFRESILSALPLCDEFIINCGDSRDVTQAICYKLQLEHPKIKIIETTWNEKRQSGGKQLAAQTNRALQECQGDWCLYLQADEVLHEKELENLRNSMDIADRRTDLDGVVFDYFHFYGNYDFTIKGRNWYRREVRLFKNHRGIESFRDAQGFRKKGRKLQVLPGNAHVFHYGYVRNPDSMRMKSEHMSKWWGSNPVTDKKRLEPVRHVGLMRFSEYHPTVMKERIKKHHTEFVPQRTSRRWDFMEVKNLLTLIWESIIPFRIGEFTNYEIVEMGKSRSPAPA